MLSVALTLDLYTPHEFANYYNGRMGMLTLSVAGVLYRVGRVISTDSQVVASILCRKLGFVGGAAVTGPWMRLHDGNYSIMEIHCAGDETDVAECSTKLTNSSRLAMAVDYFICWEQNHRSEYSTCISLKV